MLSLNHVAHIVFPDGSRRAVLDHCQRALDDFQTGRSPEGKAFGLVFGTVAGNVISVGDCFPLTRNVRSQPPYAAYMDRIMAEHAIPSVTPLEKRGWVADPSELLARIKESRARNQVLVGTYHMHRVGWDHDELRDTPTRLDAVLAENSGLVMFIVSMVDPQRPILRAFYEGIPEREIPLDEQG